VKVGTRVALELLGVIVFVTLFIHPTCNLLFRCGCRMIGFGGIAPCNMHDASTPDCPWCVMPLPALVLVGLFLVAGTWAAGHRKSGFSWVGGLFGYVLASLIGSALSAWAMGYPKWLFFGS